MKENGGAMEKSQLPKFIVDLTNPEQHDDPAGGVQLIQTHISYLLMAGAFVYKFKKPVDFGFINFSSLERRAHYCREEVRLNRRLCPDIYLDLVRVTREQDGYALNKTGETVEFGVKMIRMPQEKMMDRVIAQGKLSKGHLEDIIATLVPFYERADTGQFLDDNGEADAVGTSITDNLEQTKRFIGCKSLSSDQFLRIERFFRLSLDKTDVFNRRVKAGRIRDCHGDLHSANICLDGPVHIFDCIEFSEQLRFLDVASDVAFLAMDLDYHGLRELSEYFIERFVSVSGDHGLKDILNFYKCYRAHVRGKVCMLTSIDASLSPPIANDWKKRARGYFKLAERYAENG
jgi:uncharacterized protein